MPQSAKVIWAVTDREHYIDRKLMKKYYLTVRFKAKAGV